MTVPAAVYAKGDQQVIVPVGDVTLRDYYAGDGWSLVSEPPLSGPVEFPLMYAPPPVPAKSAHRDDWVGYAQSVDPGLSDEAVDGLTIADLIGRYAPELVDDPKSDPKPASKSKTQDSTSPES